MASPLLPSEPEILSARKGWQDAQAELAGQVIIRNPTLIGCGWYGTAISRERGAFALVNRTGALTDLVGDRLRLTHNDRSIYVYCFGTDDLDYDIHITRRSFAALELLAVERIDVTVEVVSG